MIASSPVILQFIVQIHTLRPWEVSDLKNNKLIVQSWDGMACDTDSDTPMVKAPRPVLSKNLYSFCLTFRLLFPTQTLWPFKLLLKGSLTNWGRVQFVPVKVGGRCGNTQHTSPLAWSWPRSPNDVMSHRNHIPHTSPLDAPQIASVGNNCPADKFAVVTINLGKRRKTVLIKSSDLFWIPS